MSNLKNKLNLKMKGTLKKDLENEANKGKDTRFLNYYDLKFNEKMKVLIIPDANGDLWKEFKLHGPNLKNRKVGTVNCAYTSSGEECPACQHGFSLLDMEKETGDVEYRNEAKRWFGREYTIMSVLVLDSPVEIQESPDGNQVKLMYVPYGIRTAIKEAIVESQVDEAELTSTPFVIKKTKNQGGQAAYDASYFARETVTDEDLEFFEDLKVEQYDYNDLDIIPAPSTTDEVQEWLDKALPIIEEFGYDVDTKESKGKEKAEEKASPKAKLASKLARNKKEEQEDDGNQEQEQNEESEPDPEPEKKERPSAGSLRERLMKAKQG